MFFQSWQAKMWGWRVIVNFLSDLCDRRRRKWKKKYAHVQQILKERARNLSGHIRIFKKALSRHIGIDSAVPRMLRKQPLTVSGKMISRGHCQAKMATLNSRHFFGVKVYHEWICTKEKCENGGKICQCLNRIASWLEKWRRIKRVRNEQKLSLNFERKKSKKVK